MRERAFYGIGSGRLFVVYDMLSLESDRDVIECVWCEWICMAILMKFESHYLYYLRLRVRHRPVKEMPHSRRRCRNPYREVRLSPAVSRPQRSYRQLSHLVRWHKSRHRRKRLSLFDLWQGSRLLPRW